MVRSGPATFGTNLAPDLSAPRADTSRCASRTTVSRPRALLGPARIGFWPPAPAPRLTASTSGSDRPARGPRHRDVICHYGTLEPRSHSKLTDYLPDYRKDTGDRITIHQLLNHTSGIPSYTGLPNFFQEIAATPTASPT